GWAATVLGSGSARHVGDPRLKPMAYLSYAERPHAGESFRVMPQPAGEVQRAADLWPVEQVKVGEALKSRVETFVADHEELTGDDYDRARAAGGAAFPARAASAPERFCQVRAVFEREQTSRWLHRMLTSYQRLAELVTPPAGPPPPAHQSGRAAQATPVPSAAVPAGLPSGWARLDAGLGVPVDPVASGVAGVSEEGWLVGPAAGGPGVAVHGPSGGGGGWGGGGRAGCWGGGAGGWRGTVPCCTWGG